MTTITRTKCGLRIVGIAVVVAGVAAVRLAAAQAPGEPLAVDVSECVKLTTPEERLACFESQVQGARSAPAPATGAPATAAPATAAPGTAPPATTSRAAPAGGGTSGFGLGGEAPELPSIQARVTDLRERLPNAWLITLDNGQVWRQTVPKIYPLRTGTPVRIYYSRWKAYRLTNEDLNSFIQVERVR